MPRRAKRRIDILSFMNTLVVATDGSELAIAAGVAGLAILKPCDRVLVVSVADFPDPSLADDATGHAGASMTPVELDEENRAAQARGQAAVETTITALRDRETLPDGVEAWVVGGEPGPALCKLAQEEGAMTIVVGSPRPGRHEESASRFRIRLCRQECAMFGRCHPLVTTSRLGSRSVPATPASGGPQLLTW